MTVDVEHIQYEFDMLTMCVKNIAREKNPVIYNMYNSVGFLSASNLYDYCVNDGRIFPDLYYPSDSGKTKPARIQFYNEIRQAIEDQIRTLTPNRTAEFDYKLSPSDMQYMFKLFAHNVKLMGIENRDTSGQIWADRYMVYGDRIRKRKV